VWRGDFSAKILHVANPRELHLIDPWRFDDSRPSAWYGGAAAQGQKDMDEIAASVRRRFEGDSRVVIHRAASAECAHLFRDGFFAWVYIDGDHTYHGALDDLEAYAPKVKPGGILAGEDYDRSR
jgi:hypothetical protein